MQDKKNLVLLGVVIAIGGAALWYLQSLKFVGMPVVDSTPVVEETQGTSTEEQNVSADTDTAVSTTGNVTETPSAANTTQSGASLEADIAAIAESADGSYSDATLESSFTADGANSLTEPYETE